MKTRNILSIDPYIGINSNIYQKITVTKIPIPWVRVDTIKNILKKINEK